MVSPSRTQPVSRGQVLCVVLAAVLGGLFFVPVFGFAGLVAPIVAVALACYAVTELCRAVPVLGPWRPVLALLVGLLVLAEVELFASTVGGLPTGSTVRALLDGVTQSWQLTLQSTWPARPDAELLLFVPLAVLAAAVLGVELLRKPLFALLPSVVVVGFSQAYVAATGLWALLGALGYAGLAAALLALTRRRLVVAGRTAPGSIRRPTHVLRRRVLALATGLPVLVVGIAAALVVTALDQGDRPPYSLHQNAAVPLPPTRLTNPLDQVAARLRDPDKPVFSYTSRDRVDRWRLVALDEFNGVSWSADPQYRRMGASTAIPSSITAPTQAHTATVTLDPTAPNPVPTPWLPSQPLPTAVGGIAPLIDQPSGTLLAPGRSAAAQYTVSWREPVPDPTVLGTAAIDSTATGGDVGAVPPGIAELAHTAVGDLRPTFQTALNLERYLSTHYQLARGPNLPTGSGWPQLTTFLLQTKRGTSEQFAASYVALARVLGFPARLAVGFRGPAPGLDGRVVVHNGDVLAWPEVAVAGVGWVALSPGDTSTASGGGRQPAPRGLAAVTAEARANLPPPQQLQDPDLPPPPAAPPAQDAISVLAGLPLLPIVLAVLVLAALAALAIPAYTTVRGWRRRRRTGAAGVLAAWHEARDRLRAHGVVCTVGMTVRDTAIAARTLEDPGVVAALYRLAAVVDAALWSGEQTGPQQVADAWAGVAAVRKGLARRRLGIRVRAAFQVRVLRPPVAPRTATA